MDIRQDRGRFPVRTARIKTKKKSSRDTTAISLSPPPVFRLTAFVPPRAAADPLVEAFLDYQENERNASPHTLQAYGRALEAFRAAQPSAPGWMDCQTDHFRDYLFDVMKRGQARAYVRLQFAALRSFYKYLCQRRGLANNPLKALHLPKAEKKLPQPLTAAQIDELLAAPFKVERESRPRRGCPRATRRSWNCSTAAACGWRNSPRSTCEDLDPYTENVRVLGKGRKERVCPVGAARAGSRVALPVGGGGVRRGRCSSASCANASRRVRSGCCSSVTCGTRASRRAQPAQAAPFFRHAPARRRRGPAQRAGAARPRQPLDHADLHQGHRRTPAQAAYDDGPPARVRDAGRRVPFLSRWAFRATRRGPKTGKMREFYPLAPPKSAGHTLCYSARPARENHCPNAAVS